MNEPISSAFSAESDPYRTPSARLADASPLFIPYEGQTRMRLTIASGMSRARVRIDPSADALLTVHHGAELRPALRITGSEVRLTWPARSLTGWMRALLDPKWPSMPMITCIAWCA
jgi:hypothetical protein